MSAIHTLPPAESSHYRSTNGIDVFLLWSPADDSLAVVVTDEVADSFELVVTAPRRSTSSSIPTHTPHSVGSTCSRRPLDLAV